MAQAIDLPTLTTEALIAGQWRQTGRTFPVYNPATGALIAEVADCGEAEAVAAADAAHEAFPAWRDLTAFKRAAHLRAWHDAILQERESLARLISMEMGKPIREAQGEVLYAASYVEWYAEEAKRIEGDIIPSRQAGKRLWIRRRAIGPAYGITPWNFPAAMVTRKAAPALAAGCTFILKPAEQTPLTALALARLWQETGAPEGTLQVLPAQDPAAVSKPLLADPRIRALTFTGSTEVGVMLYEQGAKTMKKVSLELGGHAPFLVFADADLDAAAREIVDSKFRNAGQTCICTNRVYVHRSILEPLRDKLAERIARLNVGDPLSPETDIGPLVDRQGLEKVRSHVADAQAKGATVVYGGTSPGGLYHQPTLLTDVRPGMAILREETFGPVLPLVAFDTDDEAITLANDTQYGLAAYLWTRDLSRAFRVAEALEYGIVGVNDGRPSEAQAPFGGIKYSGIGREGGKWGIDEFTEYQYISIKLD